MKKQTANSFICGRLAYLLEVIPVVTILFMVFATHGCEYQLVPHGAIVGKWKSNAQLTLRSLADIESITPQSRAFLEDDFFGHLETEIGEKESRTTDWRDNYDSGFEPYEVLEISDEFVRIKAWSNFFQGYQERVLYLEGDCYYEIFKQFEFRQYFCRIAQ